MVVVAEEQMVASIALALHTRSTIAAPANWARVWRAELEVQVQEHWERAQDVRTGMRLSQDQSVDGSIGGQSVSS